MCVIVVKPAGAECPDLKTLEDCWDSNPDGAGIAMSERGSVFWRKGFMNFKDFADYYEAESLPRRDNQALVFHFRIGTHGLKDGGNTHPFPLSKDPFVLRQLAGRSQVTVAHNGVFKNEVTLPKVSDTGQFVADCCLEHTGSGIPDIVAYWNRHKDVVSWSRLAVLYPKNKYTLLGTWHCKDDCGCFFSNMSWKRYTCTVPAGRWSGCGYDFYGGEDIPDTPGGAVEKGSTLVGTGQRNWLGANKLEAGTAGGPAATLAAADAVLKGAPSGCSKTQKISVAPATGGGKVWFCGKKEVVLPDGSKGLTFVGGEAPEKGKDTGK